MDLEPEPRVVRRHCQELCSDGITAFMGPRETGFAIFFAPSHLVEAGSVWNKPLDLVVFTFAGNPVPRILPQENSGWRWKDRILCMTGTSLESLKSSIYQDKVYAALSQLRARTYTRDRLPLTLSELRVFSQNGEDGVLFDLLNLLGIEIGYFVEVGTGDGWSCNCRILAESLGWPGVFVEADNEDFVALNERYGQTSRVQTLNSYVTPENFSDTLSSSDVPFDFDVLSLDVDGQDFHIWDELSSTFQPKIVVIEVNSSLMSSLKAVEKRGISSSDFLTETWGASISAVCALAESKGYTAVHVEQAGANLFAVRTDLFSAISGRVRGVLDRSANFGLLGRNHSRQVLFPEGEVSNREQIFLD